MTIQLDIAAIIAALAWPVGLVLVLRMYRAPLSNFFQTVPNRIKSLKIAGFGLEIAPTESASLAGASVTIDLRHQGTAKDINDSTLLSFYAQIGDPSHIEHAIVDLADGRAWLSSRLYVLSIILHRMRGLRAIVFVQTIGLRKRRFLGVCDASRLRWRLAARWPRLESAYAAAELRLWGHPYDERDGTLPPQPALPGQQPPTMGAFAMEGTRTRIANDEGRVERGFGDPSGAADLLQYFLDANQRPAFPSKPGWEPLSSTDPPLAEYADWLTADAIETTLADSLDTRSIRLSDLQGWSDQIRLRAVVEHAGEWVAITGDDGVFERLIDRRAVLEQMANGIISAV